MAALDLGILYCRPTTIACAVYNYTWTWRPIQLAACRLILQAQPQIPQSPPLFWSRVESVQIGCLFSYVCKELVGMEMVPIIIHGVPIIPILQYITQPLPRSLQDSSAHRNIYSPSPPPHHHPAPPTQTPPPPHHRPATPTQTSTAPSPCSSPTLPVPVATGSGSSQ